MYVDPSLIDFNLQVANIDGTDCIVNYAPLRSQFEHYNWDDANHSPDISVDHSDGVNDTSCIKYFRNTSYHTTVWRDIVYADNVNGNPIILSENIQSTRTCWVKISNSSAFALLQNYGGIQPYINTSTKKFYFRESTGFDYVGSMSSQITMSVVPPVNEWFYCTTTYTNTGVCKLYINGQLSATASVSYHNLTTMNYTSVSLMSNQTLYLDDVVCVRDILWTENFEPPTTRLLDIDYSSFDIDMKTHNNLIAYPNLNRNRNLLKVY